MSASEKVDVITPPAFVRSLVTDRLVKRLEAAAVGETITYEELAKVGGIDILSSRGRGALASAKRVLRREDGTIFEAVIGVGVKRLNGKEVLGRTPRVMGSINRKSRNHTTDLLRSVDVTTLEKEDVTRYFVAMAQMGTIAQAASRSETRRLDAIPPPDVTKLSAVGEATLRALKKGS